MRSRNRPEDIDRRGEEIRREGTEGRDGRDERREQA